MGRAIRRNAQLALDVAGPYGELRGRPGSVVAEDGTELYYEVEDVEDHGVVQRRADQKVRSALSWKGAAD